MFALVDCNSFFASCEQVFRPELRGKPVIVLSNNDGCIVARTREAKALGIPDLSAFFKIKHLLKKHRVAVFSVNFPFYGDISERVMYTLNHFSPETEIYSIDETFLSLHNMPVDLQDYGHQMKQRVWQDVRIPVSVGIAPTKTLAKLANETAKKIDKTQGVCLLDQPYKWKWILERSPTIRVWGIGKRLAKRLANFNIHTAWELANANPKMIRRISNVCVERTIEELNGSPCIALEESPPAKKQIYCTRSFGNKVSKLEPLQQALSLYASRAAVKLRAQNHYVKTIHVFMHTSPYKPNYHSISTVVQMPYPTDDTRVIISAVNKAAEQLFSEGHLFLKAGVGLIDIIDKRFYQYDMLCPQPSKKTESLMALLDRTNQRFGQNTLFLAAQGIEKPWYMRQHYRSPEYTTKWTDIPIVNT